MVSNSYKDTYHVYVCMRTYTHIHMIGVHFSFVVTFSFEGGIILGWEAWIWVANTFGFEFCLSINTGPLSRWLDF